MKIQHLSYILNVILLILLIGGMTFMFNKVESARNDHNSVVSFLEAEKDQLIKSNDLLAQDVKIINQNILSSDEEIKKLSNELSEYKKITSHTKAEIISEVKGLEIGYKFDTIHEQIYVYNDSCVHIDTVRKHFIHIPKRVEFKDEWLSLNATVGKTFVLDSLSMINKLDITIGHKKDKWYKKAQPIVKMNSYSPYSSTPYLNNLTVEKPKGKLAGKILTGAVIFVGGYITAKQTQN